MYVQSGCFADLNQLLFCRSRCRRRRRCLSSLNYEVTSKLDTFQAVMNINNEIGVDNEVNSLHIPILKYLKIYSKCNIFYYQHLTVSSTQ